MKIASGSSGRAGKAAQVSVSHCPIRPLFRPHHPPWAAIDMRKWRHAAIGEHFYGLA